ncbi:MAG TPA: restriction endonuclease subunit S, partial [Anaerolineae bacterium]
MSEDQFDLPDGWAWKTLGAVCSKPQYGYTTRASKVARGPKFVRTTDLKTNGVNWDSVPYCEEPPADLEKYKLDDGDILISRAGSVGKAFRVVNPPNAIFASYLIRFRATQAQDKYVEHFLQSRAYWDQVEESTAGITIPNINAQKLSAIEIPVAPLGEQQRIVAKIDQLFGE